MKEGIPLQLNSLNSTTVMNSSLSSSSSGRITASSESNIHNNSS